MAAELGLTKGTLYNELKWFEAKGMIYRIDNRIYFKTNEQLTEQFQLPIRNFKVPCKIEITVGESMTETMSRFEQKIIAINLIQQKYIISKKEDELNLILSLKNDARTPGKNILKRLKRWKKIYGSDILQKTDEEVKFEVLGEGRATLSYKTIGNKIHKCKVTAVKRMKSWQQKKLLTFSRHCTRINMTTAKYFYLRKVDFDKVATMFIVNGIVYQRKSNNIYLIK